MKKVILNLMILAAFLAAGCWDDAPIEASRGERDDAIASIIAGAVGYESNGLSAMVADMVTAGSGGTLRPADDAGRTALVVTQNDSTFDPSTLSQNLVLACQRNRGDAYSEWQLHYAIRYAGTRGAMPVDATTAETHADGTYRNSRLTAHGSSTGHIGFVKIAKGGDAWLSGEYRWNGATSFRDGGEDYGDVTIVVTWNRFHVQCGAEAPMLEGRCDVTIRANGPQGVVQKNGTIIFSGRDVARLSIGGRQYVVGIRSPEYLREA